MILAEVIMRVESSGNYHAVKFEPRLWASDVPWIERGLANIATLNKCDLPTARMIACTSYGNFQMLGANIYAIGFKASFASFLMDPEDDRPEPRGVQFELFTKFVFIRGFNSGEDVTAWPDSRYLDFADYYNGPGAPAAYAASMRRAAGTSGAQSA